jgi:hypothetical protein
VPAIVPAPPPEPFAVQVIIVDWLYREVDGLAEIKMPVLQHIAGYRNREVYEYLELTHDVRDSRAAAIYSADAIFQWRRWQERGQTIFTSPRC